MKSTEGRVKKSSGLCKPASEDPFNRSADKVMTLVASESSTETPSSTKPETGASRQPTMITQTDSPADPATEVSGPSTIEEALKSTLNIQGVSPSVWRAPQHLSTNWRGELLTAAATLRQQAVVRHQATQLYMQAHITDQQTEHLETVARGHQ